MSATNIYGEEIYKYKGKKIPFAVYEVDNTYYDDEEKAWCIDAYPEDENEEGTVAALVYLDGQIRSLYEFIDPLVYDAILATRKSKGFVQ